MNKVSIERIRNAVLICASLGLLTGCYFGHVQDPSGYDLPDPPQWSFDSEGAPPMVEANTAVYVFEMPFEEGKESILPRHGVGSRPQDEAMVVRHNYFYYRFFPEGRVFFNAVPIDDVGLRRAIQPDGSLKLPEGLDFDDFRDGFAGRYRLEGSHIELEFFGFGGARWSFADADHFYIHEEGELTPSGFRITNVSERHRFSWNNGSYVTLREVRRTPVAGEMKRAANW